MAGCPAPGVTENPLDTPEEGPTVVSVCYVPLFADRAEEIEPAAREACAEAGVPDAAPEYWKRTIILNECPLFKKARAAFFCKRGGDTGTATKEPPD